jgi:hypothetical protein
MAFGLRSVTLVPVRRLTLREVVAVLSTEPPRAVAVETMGRQPFGQDQCRNRTCSTVSLSQTQISVPDRGAVKKVEMLMTAKRFLVGFESPQHTDAGGSVTLPRNVHEP